MEKQLAQFVIIMALLNFAAMLYVTNDLRKDLVKLETKILKLEMEKYDRR